MDSSMDQIIQEKNSFCFVVLLYDCFDRIQTTFPFQTHHNTRDITIARVLFEQKPRIHGDRGVMRRGISFVFEL